MTVLQRVDLALRVLLELGIVAAFATWGYHIGVGPMWSVVLAVVIPLLAFAFWGAVDFRWAGGLAESLRLAQELVVSAAAALAWWASGRPVLAVCLLVLSLVYHLELYVHGGRLIRVAADVPRQGKSGA